MDPLLLNRATFALQAWIEGVRVLGVRLHVFNDSVRCVLFDINETVRGAATNAASSQNMLGRANHRGGPNKGLQATSPSPMEVSSQEARPYPIVPSAEDGSSELHHEGHHPDLPGEGAYKASNAALARPELSPKTDAGGWTGADDEEYNAPDAASLPSGSEGGAPGYRGKRRRCVEVIGLVCQGIPLVKMCKLEAMIPIIL